MTGKQPTTLSVIQGGIVDAAPPPKTLPKDAHADWNIITADLAKRRLLSESTFGIVEAYCTALWQIRECTKVIEELGMFVKGQNGVPKANPASSMMQKAQDQVSRLSIQLGLTPASRGGTPAGSGSDDDDGIGDFI